MLIPHSWRRRISFIMAVLFLVFTVGTTASAGGFLTAPVDTLHPCLSLSEADFSHLLAGDQPISLPTPESPSMDVDFGKVHKYLGYSTILLAGLAAVTSSSKSLHYGAAYSATGAALATCFTGYYEYRDRFDLDNGILAEDNVHILLGTLGALGVATAIAIADSGENNSHAGAGIIGGAAMMLSVIVIKW
ncbi:MAG: hypothetical protein C4522_19265 [Desulfobacteraceae bacterium]|nr:MAG: hypothetical protein C4522_19265 [Desulfobacteraceae bacterium]